jgi:hypothetical protein
MKAPPYDMPRDLNAILDAAVELIDPPADAVELFQATLETTISTVRGIHERAVNLPSPAEMKSLMAGYLKALRAARKTANAVAPFYWSKAFGRDDDPVRENKSRFRKNTKPTSAGHDRADRVPPPPYNFVEALDREIREVEARANFPVLGARPRDLIADMAAHAARGLLEARFIFPKDSPGVANPWRQDAPLTKGGLWLELAALIYEAVTGVDNHDMMPACRQANELLLRLPYSSTPRPPRPKSRRATAPRR